MTNAPCVTLSPYLEAFGNVRNFMGKLQKYRGVHRTVGNRAIIKNTCISTASSRYFYQKPRQTFIFSVNNIIMFAFC